MYDWDYAQIYVIIIHSTLNWKLGAKIFTGQAHTQP
jgi:hypothetical protein